MAFISGPKKMVSNDKYGLNYFIRLVARSVASVTSRIQLVILNKLWPGELK